MKKLSLTIFTKTFITTLLGIFPHEIRKKRAFFTLGLGPIFGPKNAVGKSLPVDCCFSQLPLKNSTNLVSVQNRHSHLIRSKLFLSWHTWKIADLILLNNNQLSWKKIIFNMRIYQLLTFDALINYLLPDLKKNAISKTGEPSKILLHVSLFN